TMSVYQAAAVLKDIKNLDPGIQTALGGPHVSFCARESLAAFPFVDFIVRGEGEEAVIELARAVEKGGGFENVAGLVFRENGSVREAPERPPGLDVNTLPRPARHLLPMGRYRTLGLAVSMTTSRGCPHQCIFCVGRRMVGARVRYRDPVPVVDELEYLGAQGFPQVNLADDLFTANRRHCLAVCDEILRRGLKVKWTSFARVDTVTPEVLGRMKAAGCCAVSFGVESGVPEILETIRKGITLDQVVAAVGMCTDAGIIPHASFILGLPGESPDTLRRTIEFGEKLNGLGVSYGYHLLAPFPGTRVRDQAAEYGLRILTDDWSQYHANRAIVETPTVTAAMLDEVAIKWEQAFDEYLGRLKERRDAGLAGEEEAWPLTNLERLVVNYDLMLGRVLEEKGHWPLDGGASGVEAALKKLAGRAAEALGKSAPEVLDALTHAYGKGGLKYTENDGRAAFAWVEGL
ncbi:MAG: radical SAM protein, partial [Thermodesulfobacteriota bacterium]